MPRNRAPRAGFSGVAGTIPDLIAQLGGNDDDKRDALERLFDLFEGSLDGGTAASFTAVARDVVAVPGWLRALVRANYKSNASATAASAGELLDQGLCCCVLGLSVGERRGEGEGEMV